MRKIAIILLITISTLYLTAAYYPMPLPGTSGNFMQSSAGKWISSSLLGLTNGGSNKALTAVNGGIVYSDSDSFEISAAGTSGQLVTSGGAGAPTFTNFAASTWSPSIGAATNSDSQSITSAWYLRMGSFVWFSVVFAFDATSASTASSLGISLPVSSNFSDSSDVAGTCGVTSGGDTLTRGAWQAEPTNDRLTFSFVPSTNSNNTYYCTGSYKIL